MPHLLHLLDSIILNSQKTVMQTKALNSDAMRSKLEPKPKCAHFFQHYILLSKILTMRLCTIPFIKRKSSGKDIQIIQVARSHSSRLCGDLLAIIFSLHMVPSSSRRMMQLHFHELSSRWRRVIKQCLKQYFILLHPVKHFERLQTSAGSRQDLSSP